MRVWLTIILAVLFISGNRVMAQEATPPVQPQEVIERCITSPTEPSDDWTFEGTIITFGRGNGVYGFRTDAGRYYLAYDNDSEFGRFAALSPDGQWLATYVGRMERGSWFMSFKNLFFVTAIRLVSTLPGRETYIIPFDSLSYDDGPRFHPPIWLSNTQFAAQHTYMGNNDYWVSVEPFVGASEVIDPSDSLYRDVREAYEAYNQVEAHGGIATHYGEVPLKNTSRAFFSEMVGDSGTLLIRDEATGQVYDTCIETYTRTLALSPNGDQVAVSIGRERGFVYIVDLNDWAAYRLDLAANYLIAWVADP